MCSGVGQYAFTAVYGKYDSVDVTKNRVHDMILMSIAPSFKLSGQFLSSKSTMNIMDFGIPVTIVPD